MPFTITQQLRRLPTFAELQALAGQHDVHISGNELAGDFCHPNPEHLTVTGHYVVEPSGDIRGDFTAQAMGKLAGSFTLTTGQAEVTVTEKPFLLPESVLKSKLSEALNEFCSRFNANWMSKAGS